MTFSAALLHRGRLIAEESGQLRRDVTDELCVLLRRVGLEHDGHGAGRDVPEAGLRHELDKPVGIAEGERSRSAGGWRWQAEFGDDDGERGRELYDRLRPPPTPLAVLRLKTAEALQSACHVRQKHEGSSAQDRIETLLVELELLGVTSNELDVHKTGIGSSLAGHREHLGRDIGADDPPLRADHTCRGKARLPGSRRPRRAPMPLVEVRRSRPAWRCAASRLPSPQPPRATCASRLRRIATPSGCSA